MYNLHALIYSALVQILALVLNLALQTLGKPFNQGSAALHQIGCEDKMKSTDTL